MQLPNADQAVLDIDKLRDYCLNPNHEEGKHKARQFRAKLGIELQDAERLREVILDAILKAGAREQKADAFWKEIHCRFRALLAGGKVHP